MKELTSDRYIVARREETLFAYYMERGKTHGNGRIYRTPAVWCPRTCRLISIAKNGGGKVIPMYPKDGKLAQFLNGQQIKFDQITEGEASSY